MDSFYVYILESKSCKGKIYIGYSKNLNRRLIEHENPSKTAYTKQYAPWKPVTYLVFNERKKAEEFEKYLKTHSGRAFLRKRLLP